MGRRYSIAGKHHRSGIPCKGGFDALMPKTRSDKGVPRSLNDTAMEEIYRLKEKYPRLNATQIHLRLVQDAFIPASVSVDTVQRFIRRNNLPFLPYLR